MGKYVFGIKCPNQASATFEREIIKESRSEHKAIGATDGPWTMVSPSPRVTCVSERMS